MIGGNYAYYINTYANNRVFYVQERKMCVKRHFIFVLYTYASTDRLHKVFNFSTAELKRAHIARYKKYNFRHSKPLGKTTSIFRGIFQLSL